MKKALILLLALTCCALAFSASSEIANAPEGVFAKIFANGGDANLAETKLYSVKLDFPESSNPSSSSSIGWGWEDTDTQYSNNSMLGYAGVKNYGQTTITFTRNGPDYMFYNTDFSGYRPYGVLYVLKGSTNADSTGTGDTLLVGMVGYHCDSSGFVESSSADTVTINIPATKDGYTKGEKYCWDGYNDAEDRGQYSGTHYRVYWLDLALVLNPRVDTNTNKLSGRSDTTYCLMRDGNDYRASFNVNIGERAIAFAMGGYYNTEKTTTENAAYLTVNPTAAATNLNLKNEFKDDGKTVKIGEYNFSTQSGVSTGVKYYFDVSSSTMGIDVANDTPFFLRHVVADKTNTNPINGIYFKVGLKSNQGNGTVWYDGTYEGRSLFETGTNGTDYISPKVIKETTTRYDEWNYVYHWEDSGDILIKLNTDSGKSTIDELSELRAGRYAATIYFNVYSEY